MGLIEKDCLYSKTVKVRQKGYCKWAWVNGDISIVFTASNHAGMGSHRVKATTQSEHESPAQMITTYQ